MDKERIFELIEGSQYLPELPEDISQILNILYNPTEVDIDTLIDKVSKSSELNTLMLKNINSGYFQLKREIRTIKEAIVYLGMQTVQNLLIFFITLQLFPNNNKHSHRTFDMHKYWKHVLGTSVASCMFASQLKIGDKYKLFSYGLIHDIGTILLDACLPMLIDEITEKLLNGVHQIVAERIVLGGITHADLGAWLCRKWNIREDITNIVEFHHAPFLAKANKEEVQLIYAADVISTEYYEKLLGVNLNHDISNKVMLSLGLTKEDIQAVIKEFPKELEKVTHYFSLY
jgi:HD-like signal output (HDOD) protein